MQKIKTILAFIPLEPLEIILILILWLAPIVWANAATKPTPKPTPVPTFACTAVKHGSVYIYCKDGSKTYILPPVVQAAPIAPVKPFVIDANGSSHRDHSYLGQDTAGRALILNRISGNTMGYNLSGQIDTMNKVYFEQPNCQGRLFITNAASSVKGRVYLSSEVSGFDGLKIKAIGFAQGIQSYSLRGVCTNAISVESPVFEVDSILLDPTDLLNMPLPIEIGN